MEKRLSAMNYQKVTFLIKKYNGFYAYGERPNPNSWYIPRKNWISLKEEFIDAE